MIMKTKLRIFLPIIILFVIDLASSQSHSSQSHQGKKSESPAFIIGGDVSFIPKIEDLGGQYLQNGQPTDPLQIFKNYGFNYIRLKLWHTPADGYNSLEKVLGMAKRIKEKKMKFLLNFHYSDTWADPGKQYKPSAWKNAGGRALSDSLYIYTKSAIAALAKQNTLPDMVQIGNEIPNGMLWNDGRVGGTWETDEQWQTLAGLLKAGIKAVKDATPNGETVKIMIHLDRGGDNKRSVEYFDKLLQHNVEFDVIGQSYYPWWHGSLAELTANLNDLAPRYKKDIILVEVAYPWTLQWFDKQGNIFGDPSQLHPGYPASVNGQKAFMRKLVEIIKNVPDGRGKGLFYWAPEYISIPRQSSPWENLALFDFTGEALPSMRAFETRPSRTDHINVTMRLNTSTNLDTLGESHFVQIRGGVNGEADVILPDEKMVSWFPNSELILKNVGGDYWQTTFQMYPGDALLYKFWAGFDSTKGTHFWGGWEGHFDSWGSQRNNRLFVAGDKDTTLEVQYYHGKNLWRKPLWRPFESKADTIAIYFRVNMAHAITSGFFNPGNDSRIGVRGEPKTSGSALDWNTSKVILHHEEGSNFSESFWSGAAYIPIAGVQIGKSQKFKFVIEENKQTILEKKIPYREFIYTQRLVQVTRDTTLYWQSLLSG